MIVIIGGSGFYDFLDDIAEQEIDTPFGRVSYDLGLIGGKEVGFIPRHGKGHSIPPSRINYRANIYSAHLLNARMILTTNAVGSMRKDIGPGSLAIPNQIIDFTSGRDATFFDGTDFSIKTLKGRNLSGVIHTDVTYPYDNEVREKLLRAGNQINQKVHDGGVMTVYNGPRYETPAEVNMGKLLGGDFAGMTTAPEAFLAKEIDIPYATIAVITNYAAGMQSSVSHEEVEAIFGQNIDIIKSIFREIITTEEY